jgi:CRP/FNR family transcriptional regulator, cyclic AMP receptor protein
MKTKILVIEDNQEVRENIAEILELSEYSVIKADNGKNGVEMALREQVDLIICDIMMPQLDGYGVLHLLSKHKETRTIPFIFLTAKSEKADLRKGMEMGADDYLTKPFDGIELLTAIEVRLKKSNELLLIRQPTPGVYDFIDQAYKSGLLTLTSDEREVVEYKRKHILYEEGTRPRALYLVIKGKIKIYKRNQDGKELITKILNAGDFWGYIPILENSHYKETAELLEDCSVMLIPPSDFLELVTRDPKIADQFIRLISGNVAEMEEDLLNLAYNSLRKKVAYGLVQLIHDFKNENTNLTTLSLSRKETAQAIGVATESLIRTLSDFKEEKMLDIIKGQIVITDENKLRNMAD